MWDTAGAATMQTSRTQRTPTTTPTEPKRVVKHRGVRLHHGDSLALYPEWDSPTVIVSDGAYGVGGFPGDPATPAGIADWYLPHIEAWSKYASPVTSLWFWNTEIGWAIVHPILVAHGWEFVGVCVWDKGIAHIAGNVNSKTIRRFPVVTEVCAHYVKPPTFTVSGREVSMKEWLRYEWQRSGLPLSKTNEACGVKNAATRKYFTQCHLWYFPPPEAFEKLAAYANTHGNPTGCPYFSLDGKRPLTGSEWARMRSKFTLHDMGITNVWQEPANRGEERVRNANGIVHANQKPIKLLSRIIQATSDPGDVVWEPFGGLCTAAIVSARTGRSCFAAEVIPDFFDVAADRLLAENLRIL